MKFMLMMNAPRGNGDYQVTSWGPDDFKGHIEYMKDLYRELSASGELVAAEGLTPPNEAMIVRAGADGNALVSDGPFAESKEFLAGYWVVNVPSPERAYQIAAKASAAPGPGGAPMSMPIEVRRVGEVPEV
jgi:hypothetical protein